MGTDDIEALARERQVEETAIHEPGHAVMRYLHGWSIDRVELYDIDPELGGAVLHIPRSIDLSLDRLAPEALRLMKRPNVYAAVKAVADELLRQPMTNDKRVLTGGAVKRVARAMSLRCGGTKPAQMRRPKSGASA